MKLGKNMKHALNFAKTYQGWHTYDKHCRTTVTAIKRLAKSGLVEISSISPQFRYINY